MNLPIYKFIDLTSGEIRDYPISRTLFERYLGGKILAGKLLMDLQPEGLPRFHPDNALIINTGPAGGTGAPSSGRFNMTFKNVLTGGIASSNCGGTFGVSLKAAGIDGLIITGKAKKLSYIEILDGGVSIKDASAYAGMDTEEIQSRFDKHWGKLVIGPAGESLVWYACAISGERVAGRCGAGAVMGSKNLKALTAYGTKRPEIYDPDGFTAYVRKWTAFLKNHPMTGSALPTYGTAGLVSSANASGALPTRNFKEGRFEKSRDISGESLADKRLTRNGGCVSCPIRCERRVKLNGREIKGPEYETVGLFGSNLGSGDMDRIIEINYYADIWGMDTITLAGTIAFALELQEKGMADFGLDIGGKEAIIEVLRKVGRREGIFTELANGTKWLSEKYGGKDFAIHSKGLELASYEPRQSVGMGLGYATSNRGGCHLNGGYLALIESVGVVSVDRRHPSSKAELTIMFQNMMESVSGAGFCLFTAQAVIPAIFFKLGPNHAVTRAVNKILGSAGFALRPIWWLLPGLLPFNTMFLLPHAEVVKLITGMPMTSGKLIQIGERGYNTERLFNLREGLTGADDSLPARLTNTSQENDPEGKPVPLSRMLPLYYKVRGWDSEGRPTPKKLKQLRIESGAGV
ncbi:MAG: aldehyde ferredoxin oxidoreductase family protein [Clostridiales bacterium]|jgi:aldehyde:ferredoxin oxidoreductase|nr:aldehyde ferredoxin oxidoreductase family protein [Clostridiales bacterium]